MPPSPRVPHAAGLGAAPRARDGRSFPAALRWLGAVFLLACSLVAAAWLILQWGILPRIEYWRPALEARASELFGVPVRIGVIEVTHDEGGLRWARAIELREVVLYEPAQAGAAPGTVLREALRLPRVRAALSPTSLLPDWDGGFRPRFEQLLIEGARLQLRRDEQGHIHLAGIPLRQADARGGEERAADWFFSQPEFALRGGTLVWLDEQRKLAPLHFDDISLTLRNGVRSHRLQLEATPPAGWGARFALKGDFTQPLLATAEGGKQARLLARPGDWRRWRGSLHAELPAIDLAPLQSYVPLPFELRAGQGRLSATLELEQARVATISADVALRGLALGLEPQAAPLAFESVAGRLRVGLEQARDGAAAGGEVAGEGLGFTTRDGLVWPAGNARLRWRAGPDGMLAGGELQAERLDLGLLQQILARLPARWIDGATQERLRALAPRGVASGVRLRWDGAPRAPERYRLQARLVGLQLAAGSPRTAQTAAPSEAHESVALGRPGVQGADIDFVATESGGSAKLALQDGALQFPGLFARPHIALERLSAELSWRIAAAGSGAEPRVEVRGRGVRFANADAEGEFDVVWSSGDPAIGADAGGAPLAAATETDRFPGTLDLQGRLVRADATRVTRYLPLHIPARVRQYVEQAVQAGRASAVDFKVRGDLRDFPFPEAGPGAAVRGEFRVAAQLQDLRFAYLPEGFLPADDGAGRAAAWPAFSEVSGELVFERRAIVLRRLQGRLASVGGGGLSVSDVQGGIADWDQRATLRIEGNGRGPLPDALAFLAATPVGEWIGGALAQAGPAGPNQAPLALQLALELPLHDEDEDDDAAAPQRVRGNLVLAGNDLRLHPELPPLAGAKARIVFGKDAFTLREGSARFLGGEARVEGARQADGSLRFDVQGQLSAEALKRAGELGALARAAAPLAGQAGYRLAFGFRDGQTEWKFSSDLVGLAAELPAPLGKRAEEALPLRVQAVPLATASGGAPRDRLRIELGAETARVLQAHWLRERAAGGMRVLSGGIGVFEAAPQPAVGVAANVRLASLDVDAWRHVAENWARAGAGAPGSAGDAGAKDAAGGAAGAGYAPSALALQAGELQLGGRRFHRLFAGLSRGSGPEAELWRLNVDARELHGYGEYHPAGVRGAEGAGRIHARLTRLDLPRSEADAVGSLLEQAAPARLPALDVVIDELELRGMRLGRAEIVAGNRSLAGGAAGWQLERLLLATPEAHFKASGEWAAPVAPGARRRAVLDFELDVADGGALLARLGQPGVVRGAKGGLRGQIGWLGSPLAIDYPSLAGRMHMAFDRGQFLRADPGIAKLFGVLSLQALPRRLLLDFRDVFEQGFAFESLGGDADIERGVARTRNLRMRGLQALVLMEGSADIAAETQDLRVWVVPELNADAAALAVAVINPAVGLGSFLAQWLLRRPLAQAGTREFHVTGPWADPKVERIERPGAAAPQGSAPFGPTGGR